MIDTIRKDYRRKGPSEITVLIDRGCFNTRRGQPFAEGDGQRSSARSDRVFIRIELPFKIGTIIRKEESAGTTIPLNRSWFRCFHGSVLDRCIYATTNNAGLDVFFQSFLFTAPLFCPAGLIGWPGHEQNNEGCGYLSIRRHRSFRDHR